MVKLLYFMAIIDTVNGFCMYKSIPLPIGVVYKSLFLILGLKILCSQQSKKWLMFWLFIYVPVIIVHVMLNTDSEIGPTINHLMKFLNVVVAYFSLTYVVKKGLISLKQFCNIFYLNSLVLILNIYSGLVGIGYYAYSGVLGCKGFIYSHNEMSGMMAVLWGVSYFFLYNKFSKNTFVTILINIFLLLGALLVSTKTSILLIVFVLILIPFVCNTRKWTYFLLKKKKQIILLFLLICIFIYYGYVLLEYSGAIERWSFFFEKDGFDAIYSSRDLFWEEEKLEWFKGGTFVHLLGLGGNRTVEMDHADTLLNYGIMGVITLYSFYLYVIYKTYKRRPLSRYARFVFYLDVLIFMASFYSGHLLFSGLMGIPFALMNVFVFSNELNRFY